VALRELEDLGLARFPGYLATNVSRSATVFLEGQWMLDRPLPRGSSAGRTREGYLAPAARRLDPPDGPGAGARFVDGARVQGFDVERDGIRIAFSARPPR
jgi:hypothetical protein